MALLWYVCIWFLCFSRIFSFFRSVLVPFFLGLQCSFYCFSAFCVHYRCECLYWHVTWLLLSCLHTRCFFLRFVLFMFPRFSSGAKRFSSPYCLLRHFFFWSGSAYKSCSNGVDILELCILTRELYYISVDWQERRSVKSLVRLDVVDFLSLVSPIVFVQ